MAEWKPTYYRTNGKPGATDPLRKVASKFLENMKHRNEVLGNYANPVQRFEYDGNKFVISSLLGYDIVNIIVPILEGEKELRGSAEIYSGLWEPTFNAGGNNHYLRWYPADYELFNSDAPAPVGLGASVDGAAEELLPAFMPPNRWMYNDYDATREEAPWFINTGPPVSATSIHPGKYSGKLRELVQMQLGYGLLPQFSYTASNSNGIYLEDLGDDITRVWLYQISATNGIAMQIMMDYSVERFEDRARLRPGKIPPEIEEAGWFALQTVFDSSKVVYTKAAWDALPDDERPSILTVTFELLSTAAYLSAVGTYSSYGNYGWSFNPAGTSAVMVGIEWNKPDPATLAVNYRSQLFTVTLNPAAFTASVSGGGVNPFLMDAADQVKWPNADGTLETQYFYKGENGFNGTQPSTSYTSPIYAYYDLNGALVQCDYEWDDGVAGTKNSGSAFPLGWTETVACRELTTYGVDTPAANYHYKACSTGESGTGTFGYKHGFSTKITTSDSYDIYSGYAVEWGAVTPWGNRDQSVWYNESFNLDVVFGPGNARNAMVNADEHYYARKGGDFSGSTKSVLIVPSFERLAFYHYKSLNKTLTSGEVQHPHTFEYERGTPVRQKGTGNSPFDDCEFAACGWPGLGAQGSIRPELEGAPEYNVTNNISTFVRMFDLYFACSPTSSFDCFSNTSVTVNKSTPADQNPYSEDITTVVGGLSLPDGSSIAYSEDEIDNQSKPFRESSGSFGYQSVISAFDTFSNKYIFSMPNIALTDTKHTATGFPDDIAKSGVLFSGMPYFIG